MHKKKWLLEEERLPWAIGVGQSPGTARDISLSDS